MKIFCIGKNYAAHVIEMGGDPNAKPVVFMKPATALLLENKPFYIPDFSEEVHYEVELLIKICKNGKHVQPAYAHTYYEKIGLGVDFTARDLQAKCKANGHPWEVAKAFDQSAVIGKWLDKSAVNVEDLSFSLQKNGEEVQRGHTSHMMFNIDQIICYLSQYFTLQTGDLIFTGTPEGVGPVKAGDQLQGFMHIGGKDELCFDFQVR